MTTAAAAAARCDHSTNTHTHTHITDAHMETLKTSEWMQSAQEIWNHKITQSIAQKFETNVQK